jgi:transcriptional regulator
MGEALACFYAISRGAVVKPEKVDLLQGTLDLIVLKLLQAGAANGWDLTQAIQATSGGALSVNYGTLYPALHRLEARGWVTAKWGTTGNNRRARFYSLTPAGRRRLAAEQETWERFSRALGLILRPA